MQAMLTDAFGLHSPEDQLLLQFQGMILRPNWFNRTCKSRSVTAQPWAGRSNAAFKRWAEYERAQIPERSRRGKRHRAKQGEASVLSAAP